ncbi:MAG: hypothetical protein V3R70_02065 [Syntrophobacteria bacterium]
MNIRTTKILLFLVAFFVASLSAVDGFAERTLHIKMGDIRCDTLSLSGKPPNGGYHVEEVWVQSDDIVKYSIDKDKGLICFEPLNVGNTKVKVHGQRYQLDRYGKQKSSEPFYRAFKVRIRPEKKSGTSGRMY